MEQEGKQKWWQELPDRIGGDVVIAEVGAGATGVAAGKNITQQVYGLLGEPAPDDRMVIEQEVANLASSVEGLRGQIEDQTAEMARFQIQLLEGELTKTEEDQTPSASTITKVGDWLLENIPDIAEVLAGLFATPAVGRVVGKAGEASVAWVKQRFGKKA